MHVAVFYVAEYVLHPLEAAGSYMEVACPYSSYMCRPSYCATYIPET